MASVDNNQNPWAPYDNYKDCSSEICSIYCPQYCYLIFPPPPLSDDDSGTPFSPLIIAIIGVLASAFILVCYYTIATRYWRRRNVHDSSAVNDEYHSEISREQQQQTLSAGLDEELIKSITVCNYRKGEGLIEGSECVVCLSEFQENESVRLLPKCDHAFHLPCIDTWLRSHSNCPLCRANVIVLAHPTPVSQSSPVINMNSYEIHRPDDLILVVDDRESNCDERVVLENLGNDQEGVDEVRRSMSVGAFSCQRELMVSDILKIEETDEDLLVENVRTRRGVGSSMGLLRSPVATERYVFSSPFMFMVHDNGKNSMHQN